MPKEKRRLGPLEPCPCGSGKINQDCHQIRQVLRLRVHKRGDPQWVPPKPPEPFAVSAGGYTSHVAQVCGACGKPLLVGVGLDQVQNLLMQCQWCGADNQSFR